MAKKSTKRGGYRDPTELMIIFLTVEWPKCVDDRHRGGINDDLDRDGVDSFVTRIIEA